jgi:hypothetical protein
LWEKRRDLLSYHSHIWLAAAVVAETIETKAVVQAAKKNDVVLQSDIGAPSAPAATTAATTTEAATATATRHGATAAATVRAQTTAASTAAVRDVLPTSAARPRRAMRSSRFGALP